MNPTTSIQVRVPTPGALAFKAWAAGQGITQAAFLERLVRMWQERHKEV